MSSIITIGFPDRAQACIQVEFSPPIADDERRELLIHAVLLTARALAALPPDRQRTLAGILKEWMAERFASCPVQVVAGDPMACPQRFVATFLTPVREFALATIGCGKGTGGIEYFLPMAAAAFLRYLASTDGQPEELLRPALALCAAVVIHPITVENHFQMAVASLPKGEPVVDRTDARLERTAEESSGGGAERPERREERIGAPPRAGEIRRSLIISACLAALLIVVGVQYLSTRESHMEGGGGRPQPAAKSPVPAALPTPPPASSPSPEAVEPQPLSVRPSHAMPVVPSPQVRAYLKRVRDLAENSLAQVEVMMAAAENKEMDRQELADAIGLGTNRLDGWRRHFAALVPPPGLRPPHQEIAKMLDELKEIARSLQAGSVPRGFRERLLELQDRLARLLNDLDAG